MWSTKNGWTKEKMIETIMAKNTGRKCEIPCEIPFGYSSRCMYRNGDNHCAVGAFIPEGHPGESYYGSATALLAKYKDLVDVMPLGIDGLRALQRTHDLCTSPDPRPGMVDWIKHYVLDAPGDPDPDASSRVDK